VPWSLVPALSCATDDDDVLAFPISKGAQSLAEREKTAGGAAGLVTAQESDPPKVGFALRLDGTMDRRQGNAEHREQHEAQRPSTPLSVPATSAVQHSAARVSDFYCRVEREAIRQPSAVMQLD
jgi:hypothetical protein